MDVFQIKENENQVQKNIWLFDWSWDPSSIMFQVWQLGSPVGFILRLFSLFYSLPVYPEDRLPNHHSQSSNAEWWVKLVSEHHIKKRLTIIYMAPAVKTSMQMSEKCGKWVLLRQTISFHWEENKAATDTSLCFFRIECFNIRSGNSRESLTRILPVSAFGIWLSPS